jgi:hypothetical protein
VTIFSIPLAVRRVAASTVRPSCVDYHALYVADHPANCSRAILSIFSVLNLSIFSVLKLKCTTMLLSARRTWDRRRLQIEETLLTGGRLGLVPCFTSVQSPESNGTFKRDYAIAVPSSRFFKLEKRIQFECRGFTPGGSLLIAFLLGGPCNVHCEAAAL